MHWAVTDLFHISGERRKLFVSWQTLKKIWINLNTGYFIFIETSQPRQAGDKALLLSESLTGTGNTAHCFSFWYHMYGTSVGTLNVYIVSNGSLPGTLNWHLSGNQDNAWRQGRFPITSSVEFNVSVESGGSSRCFTFRNRKPSEVKCSLITNYN